ncbi:UNKNOWN [Stylonychia lemnae]|uniref:Uncharacterized protein n=1 Tax=Stylonychia lemnae TaxID=5949 RepID=A0A078B271_STYLE|nr:UNKNOWN [Stylonychia lemnae]|eukprot:CDW88351.1 UNKNOWN [Stylonychia lemnae]
MNKSVDEKEIQVRHILPDNEERSDQIKLNFDVQAKQKYSRSTHSPESKRRNGSTSNKNQNEEYRFETPKSVKRLGLSIVDVEPSDDPYYGYFISNYLLWATQIASLVVISMLFKSSNITPHEIVYAQGAVVTLTLFFVLYFRGIYVLDVAANQRTNIIVKGFMYFVAITFLYGSMTRLNEPAVIFVIFFCANNISLFFIEKHERRMTLNVWVMSLSLILLLLIFMTLLQPLILNKASSSSKDFTPVVAFIITFISGMIFSFIQSHHVHRQEQRNLLLQNFYGNCISACFSPFFILREISDRKKMTKYGFNELIMLSILCFISVLSQIYFDIKVKEYYSYFEKLQNNKQVIVVRLSMLLFCYIYCFKYFIN